MGGCVYYQQPKYCSRKPLDSRRTEDRYAEGNMERSCGQQLFLFSLDGRCSYLRMKNVTLSYTFSKTLWNFFRSGTIYVTGENLLTFTDYLGMDPEFSYSYAENMQGFDNAKLMQPKTVKMGVNLKF